ncbi:MGH1-like glycoside hydrolase domain-containing protein [Ruania alba]|uniref:Mannosylglycerate hydrolase MGH1-like glycoside hydrolase domain-containing protein n=1 Tax=Ruania alba TaxID=648782 RepID=A0A1H5LFN5_9MICO|nr:hypothetical protein [Ruania alba]SEE75008.1 hypothetical protein SAMN04488554_2747 [Ruania alba]
MDIDASLTGPHRGLRTRPGTLLLGPAGRRLWVDYLDDQPGFAGRIDYIHKLNMPLLFTVRPNCAPDPQRSDGQWLPSRLRTTQRFGDAQLTETRFITWDDCAVSIQHWRNQGSAPITLRADYDRDLISDTADLRGRRYIDQHDFTLLVHLEASRADLWAGIQLEAGQECHLTIVATVRHLPGKASATDPTLPEGPATGTVPVAEESGVELLAAHRREYQHWYASVPTLVSDNELLNRLWAYRWYILRNSMSEPGLGHLPGTVMYEGRSHKMTKAPWRPTGWEFSKVIPLSTSLHVQDLRWRADPADTIEVLSSAARLQGTDGQLYSHTVREQMKPYANYFGWAMALFAQLHGAASVPDAVLVAAKEQVRGEHREMVTSDDELSVVHDHKRTGKEYQPSYWYFHDYPADPKDKTTFTPLKRVDRAVYQYLNAKGVVALCAARQDPDEQEFRDLARRLAASILAKQWDPGTEFFYDLHHRTDERAMVRNVVGFYPWWAGLTDERHTAGLRRALAPGYFGGAEPYPSVAQDCPAFRPAGGWLGNFIKGRNGCMWNGPSWPYTTAITLDAIARTASADDADLVDEFASGFWALARQHFRDGDVAVPYLVEHYDGLTGEPISDEPDYNHSFLIDVIVRYVAGLRVEDDGLFLEPLEIGLGQLRLAELPVGSHRLTIELTGRGDGRSARVQCGEHVLVDGPVRGRVRIPECPHP